MALGFSGVREPVRLSPEESQTVDRRLDALERAVNVMDGMRMSDAQLDRLAGLVLRAERLAITTFQRCHRR